MAGDTIIIEVYKIMENMSSLVQEYQSIGVKFLV